MLTKFNIYQKIINIKERITKTANNIDKFVNKNVVIGEGYIPSHGLILGEAPGQTENEKIKPFIGKSGQLLRNMMSKVLLNQHKVFITNIVPVQPHNNITPNKKDIIQFQQYISELINIINPSIILCVGKTASNYLYLVNNNKNIIHTYHPSYIIRSNNEQLKIKLFNDLNQFRIKLDYTSNTRIIKEYIFIA